MIHQALGRPVPVELTGDARIRGRVRRLTLVSVVALGMVFGLAATTVRPPPGVLALLGAGWILMPSVLAWSLAEPRARYLLAVPATLVTLGLVALCVGWLPAGPAAAGWLLVTAGILLGGSLGLWLWYRLLPVPGALDDPLAPGRWALIAVHAGAVVVGLVLAAGILG